MTAVATPPSFQPLPRLGWTSVNHTPGDLNSVGADDFAGMFMPRKAPQRTNSSSSISSSASSSSTSTISTTSSQVNGTPIINGDPESWVHRKKAGRGLWPSSKADPVSGISNARPQSLPTQSSGQSAASAMSAIHQPSPILPSQSMSQATQQQNVPRVAAPASNSNEPHAILVLIPMNGTFERKQISVPFLPDVLRIGRQTNAKTVPTPTNGYFDSKVLSRQHAEVWADKNNGKVWIRDVKSSNGTFVNSTRLSPENRDSDPHVLREHDLLELGIDIVSEDQKSIVHHKVSAKVEHAGIINNGTNVLDLNFSDIDPASGGGLMGPPFPQHMSQVRGRGGSMGSAANNSRTYGPHGMAAGNMNGLVAQRQMNSWLNPITIEQVVKKLTSELKQAKQQSLDLNHTNEFFSILLNQEPGQVPPKSPSNQLHQEAQPNGVPHPPKIDLVSPFSQPPAPPPQQPLPEKPDSVRSTNSELHGQIPNRKVEAERPLSRGNISPVKPESSSQILSLIEALTSAKREIDSQGDRVRHLEELLKQERKARESAEERTRRLLEAHVREIDAGSGAVEEEACDRRPESTLRVALDSPNAYDPDEEDYRKDSNGPESQAQPAPSGGQNFGDWQHDIQGIDASTSRLQERLDQMVKEMDEMKQQMERYRQRAEKAEDDRTSLAEMVERIRRGEVDAGAVATEVQTKDNTEMATQTDPSTNLINEDLAHSSNAVLRYFPHQNGKVTEPFFNLQKYNLNKTMTTAIARSDSRNDKLMTSAPYASMLGVVLIGVGIMTYLNGWQKVER